MFTAHVVELIIFYLFLSVFLVSLWFFLQEVILLSIFLCKYFGWTLLYEAMLAGLPYKKKRKYLHVYEGVILPPEPPE